MKKRKTIDTTIIYLLIIFFIISIVTIYSSLIYLPKTMNNLLIKQTIFYLLGFGLIFIIQKTTPKKILKYSFLIYLINVFLLGIVLIFGTEINGTKAWLDLPLFGAIQPSEFMKIGLILFLATTIENSKKKNQKEILIILKCIVIFLIPTVLTFLEPDTGAVLVYFIITFTMLFISGIKYKWFLILFVLGAAILGTFFYIYFNKIDLFIKIFGSSFFYRIDRILDFVNTSGMQLENSIISVSSSGMFGHGVNNIPIYFPELQTDFIFASYISCFGLFGGILIIILFIIFDLKIINIGLNNKNDIYKLVTLGIVSVLLYQQIQNMGMTIALLPITGITLPFISSGGSSLLSFMILIGIVLNITKKE